jgi:hypothetical protein
MVLTLKKGASRKDMEDICAKLQPIKGVDTKKYCGTIKLKGDPLVIQRRIRREWQ